MSAKSCGLVCSKRLARLPCFGSRSSSQRTVIPISVRSGRWRVDTAPAALVSFASTSISPTGDEDAHERCSPVPVASGQDDDTSARLEALPAQELGPAGGSFSDLDEALALE